MRIYELVPILIVLLGTSIDIANATSDSHDVKQDIELTSTPKKAINKLTPQRTNPSTSPDLVNIIDPWSAAYVAKRPKNMNVSKACRKAAFREAATQHKKLTGKPIGKHLSDERKRFAKGEIDGSTYFNHLTQCETFCARLVGLLLSCKLDVLSQLVGKNTLLVLFGHSKDQLSPAVKKKLKRFSRKVKSKGYKVLVYGSSSKLSPKDNRPINKILSKSRAESVRQALVDNGIAPRSIFMTWINQETPRLSNKRVARRLGYLNVWYKLKRRKRLKFIDQNVLIVAWKS